MTASHMEIPAFRAVQALFAGWDEPMIRACLQGHMGTWAADGLENPRSAAITVGDFCFLAGRPSPALAAQAAAYILVPKTADWCPVIEAVWGDRVRPHTRYATRRDVPPL